MRNPCHREEPDQVQTASASVSFTGPPREDVIKRFYVRLVATGKPKMVAVVAAMRKLLTIINNMVRNEECWRGAGLSPSK